MERDIVIYVGGGGMLGVYGAGVVSTFEDINIYPHVKAIYGSSAGALDVAYFLAHQTHMGSTIYYEDLLHKFIYPRNLLPAILQRIWNRWIHKIQREKILNVIDIDYAFDVVEHKKVLDVDVIFKSDIDFYIGLLNIKSKKSEYVKATRENIWDLLRASASIVPYYFPKDSINDKGYIDGSIADPIALDYLLNRYSESKIILVINEPICSTRHKIKNALEGLVSWFMYDKFLYSVFSKRGVLLNEGIKKAKADKNILLLQIPENKPINPGTTDKKKLIIAYNMGEKDGLRVGDFIENSFNIVH